MDRYVIREPRLGNHQPNQMIALPSTSSDSNSMTMAGNAYYGTYEPVFSNAQLINNPSIIVQNPGQVQSGIDFQYLATYPGTSNYVAGQDQNQGQHLIQVPRYIQIQRSDQCLPNHGQLFMQGQKQIHGQAYMQQPIHGQYIQEQYNQPQQNIQPPQAFQDQQIYQADANIQNINTETTVYNKHLNKNFVGAKKLTKKYESASKFNPKEVTNKPIETVVVKQEAQNLIKTRSNKFQAFNESRPRAFSGPVEKVLKWHKVLKETDVLILYEIVAKCLSVRQGRPSEKILVIRDENGPAMEVVYYEIDFLLPDITLPCSVRVVGRMLVGTCRLQAFTVRAATDDDITALPRRAAFAQHCLAKLAKEHTQ